MHESWREFFEAESKKNYFLTLQEFLDQEYTSKIIYPQREKIYSAFETDLQNVKVIVIGQDPYHEPNQAHGLAFSVNDKVKIPPSLRNIYKEIQAEYGGEYPTTGNLDNWSKQGVLLLNNVLTVEAQKAGSHRKKGWELFTNNCIEYLNANKEHLVFLLWGKDAQQKEGLIDSNRHLVLKSAHPSPLSASRGFFGNNHFKLCNRQLLEWNLEPIDWINATK